MISDLLNTCHGDYISITCPQTLLPSIDDSIDEERCSSPAHLSSALSISSKVSCFSQRLAAMDKKKTNNEKIKLAVGRGIDAGFSRSNMSVTREINDDNDGSIINSNATSPTPSLMNNSEFYLYKRKKIHFI
jgi:hypothetical protein